ncbi:MAG: winged helix DNA-binding domain-containing protein [Candidatus Methanofastidiosum sp.]|nr:winged helix DNA-binding domain-containing protein [Methanofastidiosum sp.]
MNLTNSGSRTEVYQNSLNNFDKSSLDREIIEKRLVKIRFVRKTVHILPREYVSAAFSATKEGVQIASEKYYKYMGITESEYEKISKSILELLGNNGLNTSEIKKDLNTETNLSPVINLMCDLGILVRGLSKGGWKSNAHTYYRTDRYLPDINLSEYSQDAARKIIVSQYLSSFDPVTITDIS